MLPQDPSSSQPPPTPPAPGWVPPPGPDGQWGQPGWGTPGGWTPPPQKKKRFGWVALTLAFLLGGVISFVVSVALVVIIGLNYAPATASHPPAGEGATLPKVGDCLLPSAKTADVSSDEDIVDCEERHGSEVAAVLEMPSGSDVPGHEDLARYADQACTIAFEGYVGSKVETSSLGYLPVIPTAAAWNDGDTRVVCLVKVGGLHGTVRNSHD